MHPIEIIQILIASSIVVLAFSFLFFQGKQRKNIQWLALFLIVSFSVIYFVRPFWIDMQIEKKISYIQLHLENKYPDETWEFQIVPHREEGYESSNPYLIGVVFENEPQVVYSYLARNKYDITIQGFSTSDPNSEFLHLE